MKKKKFLLTLLIAATLTATGLGILHAFSQATCPIYTCDNESDKPISDDNNDSDD